jgi:hypothetical protein
MKSDVEPGVVSVLKHEPIDVPSALEAAIAIAGDEALATELVRIAIDSDVETIGSLIAQCARIQDEVWRARTLFSIFTQLRSKLISGLPESAQAAVVSVIESLTSDRARALALRKLPNDIPEVLRRRLLKIGDSIGDPFHRLEVAIHFERELADQRLEFLLDLAVSIAEVDLRADALGMLTGILRGEYLERAYDAAKKIEDRGAGGMALLRIAQRFDDEARRRSAQLEILELASSISDRR